MIETDEIAFEAFCFMNMVIYYQNSIKNYSKKNGAGIDCNFKEFVNPKDSNNNFGWRPFQIAFILMNLSGIVNPKHKDPEIYIPENLYLIGTVNMDETTFPFSKKVLDRANTIEFSYVDLVPDFEEVQDAEACEVTNDFLKSEYIVLKKDVDVEDQNFVIKICSQLQSINEILQEANSHVGYRVRDEIVFYMLNNKKSGLLAENEAMDNEIMQKILPRIQGSGISVMGTIKAFVEEYYKNYRHSPSTTEIADAVGIARGTAYKYLVAMNENGMIRYDGQQISTEQTEKVQTEFTSVALLGAVSCGVPTLEEEYIEEYVSLPASMFGKGTFFLLRAKGESMIEAGISPGDLVLVRKQSEAMDGDIVVALVANENTLKRYFVDKENQKIRLHPENKTMKDIIVSDCKIQGVAVKVIKNLE